MERRKLSEKNLDKTPLEFPLGITRTGTWCWDALAKKYSLSVEVALRDDSRIDMLVSFSEYCRLIDPRDRKETIRKIRAFQESHEPIILEHRVLVSNQDSRWVAIWGRFRNDGSVDGIYFDVTNRTAKKSDQSSLQPILDHLCRLATVGELAAEMVHELYQPVYSITNFSNACRRTLSESKTTSAAIEEANACLDQIQSATRFAVELMDNLRSFTTTKSGDAAMTDIGRLAKETLSILRVDQKYGATTIDLDVPDQLPKVMVRQSQIKQVLLNLVRNAVEASNFQGIIVVNTQQLGDKLRVQVADNGPGVKNDINIFQSFVSTKKDGMGLGLTISSSIVRSHGGEIGHYPNPDGGTIFHFDLPID